MNNYWTLLNTNHWLIARRIIVTVIAISGVATPANAATRARCLGMRQLNVVAVDVGRIAGHRVVIWAASTAADNEWWRVEVVGDDHDAIGAAAHPATATCAACYQIYRQRCRCVIGLLHVRHIVPTTAVVVHVLLKVALVDDVKRDRRGTRRRLLKADERWRWIAVHRVNVAAAVDQNISSSLRTWWYQR